MTQVYSGFHLVIVPAWRRAGFLHATLTRLLRADPGTARYWVALDRGHDAQVLRVAEQFREQVGARLEIRGPRPHHYHGNSHNVLTAYRDAAHTDAALVHLVEEDIFAASDYFNYAHHAHRLHPNAFAVSACRSHNRADDPPAEERAVWLSGRYQSLAVSFRPERLRQLVVPHVGSSYFRAPGAYLRARFPGSKIHAGHTEQDGLIDRICERRGLRVVYPAVPRAYHAGFQGYNRNGTLLHGTPAQVSRRLLAMDQASLNAHAHSYRDHRTTPLDAPRASVDHTIEWP